MCAAVFSFIHILCRYLHASLRHYVHRICQTAYCLTHRSQSETARLCVLGWLMRWVWVCCFFFTTDFAGISDCLFNMHALFGRGAGVFVKWHMRGISNHLGMLSPDKRSIRWYSAFHNRFCCILWFCPQLHDRRNHLALFKTGKRFVQALFLFVCLLLSGPPPFTRWIHKINSLLGFGKRSIWHVGLRN